MSEVPLRHISAATRRRPRALRRARRARACGGAHDTVQQPDCCGVGGAGTRERIAARSCRSGMALTPLFSIFAKSCGIRASHLRYERAYFPRRSGKA
jgi:hypothetical protein